MSSVSRIYTGVDPDMTDQLYVDMWKAITTINEAGIRRETFKTLLNTMLKNRVKNHMRDALNATDILNRFHMHVSIHDPIIVKEVDMHSFRNHLNDPIRQMEEEESHERYDAIMSGLPATLRLVAELYYVDGCTQEEIACHLGLYQVKVMRLITKATAYLRARYTYFRKARANGDL